MIISWLDKRHKLIHFGYNQHTIKIHIKGLCRALNLSANISSQNCTKCFHKTSHNSIYIAIQ